MNTNILEQQPTDPVETLESNDRSLETKDNIKIKETRRRLYLLRDVFSDHKEMITRPTITLIPSVFSLFSLPLFIISFSFGCQNLDSNGIRYSLIAFYFISFIPQIITFFLYVYPSSLYFTEWRSTKIGQWFAALRQQNPVQNNIVHLPTKEEALKNLSESH